MGIQIYTYNKGMTKIKSAELEELCNIIRSGKYAKQCNNLRWKLSSVPNLDRNYTVDEVDKLPIARFSITAEGAYSGLVRLSFKCRDAAEQDYLRKVATALPQTLMCFTGSSQKSLKIITRFTLPDGSVPIIEEKTKNTYGDKVTYFHQHAYYKAAKFYTAQTGAEPERKSPRIERGCRISSDGDAYINLNALPIIQEQPTSTLTVSIIRKDTPQMAGYANKSLPGYSEFLMAQTKWQYCYRNALRQGGEEVDLFIMALAHECMKNGLEQEFSVRRLLHINPYQNYEMLVRGCFNNIYNVGKMGNDCAIPEPSIEMAQLRDFLKRRYKFRRNGITNQIEYIEEGMYMFDWSPLTKEATNTITISALNEGIIVWDKDIKRFVESTFVGDYDPVHDYLNNLPVWDGKDRISELARRVPTANKDWTENFHCWMLGMVAQWLGMNKVHSSTMVPMIIGAQGDGKSTFCKLLLPEELRNYYTDRLDFTNKNEAEKALSRFCLINIDEYDSITKRQTAFLKHILQKTSVMSRQLYSSVIKNNERYSAFIATTNDPTPLTDPSGSRRYMCIKTIGKIDTRTPYDYDQIYAQLRTELQQGAKSWFDAEEETKIQKENRDFEQYDILQEVFNELFHKPKGSEKGVFITVSGILHKMHARYKSLKEDTSTYQRLGRYLKRQNYKNQKRRIGSEYYVAQNE